MKTTDEMNLNEFTDWATGYTVLSIGEGRPLRDIISMILLCVCNNQVFGGKKYV